MPRGRWIHSTWTWKTRLTSSRSPSSPGGRLMSQSTTKVRCPYHGGEDSIASVPANLSCGCQAHARHGSAAAAREEATAIDGRVAEANGSFVVVLYQTTQVGG